MSSSSLRGGLGNVFLSKEHSARDESLPLGAEVRLLVLNSRRVTSPVLCSLAVELGLPMAVSTEDLHQMVNAQTSLSSRRPQRPRYLHKYGYMTVRSWMQSY